eukprot:1137828-Pelagomonas_calceolata.AAC.9
MPSGSAGMPVCHVRASITPPAQEVTQQQHPPLKVGNSSDWGLQQIEDYSVQCFRPEAQPAHAQAPAACPP